MKTTPPRKSATLAAALKTAAQTLNRLAEARAVHVAHIAREHQKELDALHAGAMALGALSRDVAESEAELAVEPTAEPTAETLLAEITELGGQSLDVFMSHAGRARICLRNNPAMRSQATKSLAATLDAMRANLAARVTQASARRLVEALESEFDNQNA